MATDELLKSFATDISDLDTTFEESGNVGLDMALSNGKGIPLGSYIILAAGNGAGKTTTSMDIARRILARWKRNNLTDNKILYIDMEKSKELAKTIGLGEYIKDGTLLYKPGLCSITQLEKISQNILDGKKPYCYIKYMFIDSITNLICEKEMNAEIEKGDYGNAVAARNKWYKKYLAPLETLGITIFGISQYRKKQQAMQYEDQNKAAVADGDLHYADIILKVKKSIGGNDSETKKTEIFNATTGKTEKLGKQFKVTYEAYGDKNRYGHLPSVTSLMSYGRGCHNWYIIKTLLTSYDFLENAGSASAPKWNFSPELVAFVGEDNEGDLSKKDMQAYIGRNLPAIKDYLRTKNCYCISKELGESEED